VTIGIAGPGGGPPPPAPPPPPGFPLDGNLFYLFVFGLLLAFLKLRKYKFLNCKILSIRKLMTFNCWN